MRNQIIRKFSSLHSADLSSLKNGIPKVLPAMPQWDGTLSHAPRRITDLDTSGEKLAIKNALRYFPPELHSGLAPEFYNELQTYGHIYMYRLRPTEYEIRAYSIDQYPAKCQQAAAIMLMIMNNLDKVLAQHPHELITYGGNGSVFSNWAQYHLTMQYLSQMENDQTLVMYSGHPMGLFPSHPDAPRVVVTNGMVIPNYSTKEDYSRMYAQGVSQYGQMTAGSYCYIGPQGIVHGTTISVLGAGRKFLGMQNLENSGVVYVTSGLGGMSGAQGKAGSICGCISIIAEMDKIALLKRYDQGWIQYWTEDLNALISKVRELKNDKGTLSIGFLGNIVNLWEALAESDITVELGSDQTSLHNPYSGGYYPAGLSFEESKEMMGRDSVTFKKHVQESLRRHTTAINKCVSKFGTYFFDYGNCFLLEASRANAEIMDNSGKKFRYPSYVQDVMGDVFSLGFGPYRWVCTSGKPEDLSLTDQLAHDVLTQQSVSAPPRVKACIEDNIHWIANAGKHKMVVGSQARILYAHDEGRIEIALAMNQAVRDGRLSGPVVISRDHHDVSGTDSPFRETSDVYDGSSFCADMAVQNFCGDAFRGATWVSLHNGGGVGWGEVMNGGFGMVLDGTEDADRRIRQMLHWDVNNGIARRAWAGNDNANFQIQRAMDQNSKLTVTLAQKCEDSIIDDLFS